LGRRRGRRRRRLLELVELADDHEDGEGDDDEVDDRVDELAVADDDGGAAVGRALQRQGEAREVHVAEQDADGRHQHSGDEGPDDLPEGGPDDYADRHVDDVPSHREVLEFLEECRHSSPSLSFEIARTGALAARHATGPNPSEPPAYTMQATMA